MRKITADYVFPVTSTPIKEGVVVLDDNGCILEIGHRKQYAHEEMEIHRGIIIPGFINTHCHLELSHMEGLSETGTGLLSFLKTVVKLRDFEMGVIENAIHRQDSQMWENGIMAVADICNTDHTVRTKAASNIRYYNFIEMFDFMQPVMTGATIAQYSKVYDAHRP